MGMFALAGAAALMAASTAEAQTCAGFPNQQMQSAVGARMEFLSGATAYGVEGSYNARGPLSVFGNVNVRVPEGSGSENRGVVGAGVALDVTSRIREVPSRVSVCPMVAGSFSSNDGNTELTVPVGVGFGTTLHSNGRPLLTPYVIPQFVLTRLSADGVDVVTDTNFGIGAGALAHVGRGLYVGGTVGRVFTDGASTDFTLRAGVTLGPRR